MKNILGIYNNPRGHWVGDGFPVRSLFTYQSHGKQLSPFLMLDYAGPAEFTPTTSRRGVGQHPHRGFETVSIIYEGEVAHHDSTGQGGIIGPGDVQWMTAGSGILHEEFHSEAFSKTGGRLHMVQLWVNLPAKDKMTPPAYQALLNDQIPVVDLPNNSGTVRLIAGQYQDQKGPASTFTPMNVWDLHIKANVPVVVPAQQGWNTALVVLNGKVRLNDQHDASEGQLIVYANDGQDLALEASTDATLLLLSGEPIHEPIVGHGPFVMNTMQEIKDAITDFNNGAFGQMT
jgi:redox-sensitive bicupin YhaK (pirin superfamily)